MSHTTKPEKPNHAFQRIARIAIAERGRSVKKMNAESKADLVAAIFDYRRTCERLIQAHTEGTLEANWTADEHGEHCRFQDTASGHIVEAPFALSDEWFYTDPYFFGEFVLTGPGYADLKTMINHSFHDTAALLDELRESGSDAPGLIRPRTT